MANEGIKLSNFEQMPLNELRKYVLENREDEKAWKEFVNRPHPNATIVSVQTPLEEQKRILKQAGK